MADVLKLCHLCSYRPSGAETTCPRDGAWLVAEAEHSRFPADAYLGRILSQTYAVERVLGQGGMGRVYAGTDVRLGRKVAIKVLLPGVEDRDRAMRRFVREAKAAAALGHQHIVVLFDVGELGDGSVFLIMEHLEGETLRDRLRRVGPLPFPEAASIIGQAAKALTAAHAASLVHRDLKPDNIMLLRRDDRDDFVKVLDFGLAKPVSEDADEAVSLTQANIALGTPAYMSPEQARARPVDYRSDIYSLGMVAYAAVCGHAAFQGPAHAIVVAQASDPPPPPSMHRPDLPPGGEAAILRVLAKDPAARFDTAEAFARAFAAGVLRSSAEVERALLTPGKPPPAVGDSPPGAGPLTRAVAGLGTSPTTLRSAAAEVAPASAPSGPPARRRSLRPGVVAMVAALVLAVGAGAAFLSSGPRRHREVPVRGATSGSGTEPAPAALPPQAALPAPAADAGHEEPDAGAPAEAETKAAPLPTAKTSQAKKATRALRPAPAPPRASAPPAKPKAKPGERGLNDLLDL